MKSIRLKIILTIVFALLMTVPAISAEKETNSTAKEDLQAELTNQLKSMSTGFIMTSSAAPEDMDKTIEDIMQREPYLRCIISSIEWQTTGSDDSYTTDVKASYNTTPDEQAAADEMIDKVISEIIKPYMTDHEKIKTVHDWIVLNGQYDTTLTHDSDYDLLTKGTATCNGYALLTYKMLNAVAIPNYFVFGTGKSGEAHVWNLVKAGDYWFHLDTTWNDPVPDKKNTVSYEYYMLTDKEVQADHNVHSDPSLPKADREYYRYLADLSKSSYNGYVYETLLIETGLELYFNENVISSVDTLNKTLNKKVSSLPLKISVRLGKSLTEKDAQNAMSEMLKNNNISEINYDPIKPDKTGSASILTMYLKYRKAPDRIETDFSDKVYNMATVVNYNVYAIYGSTKVKINDEVILYPYSREFLSISDGTLKFLDAGYQNLTFEYGGKKTVVNVTAINSKGFQYITDKRPDSQINVKVFDRYIDFGKSETQPFIEESRTLVPLRAIFETLNCEVDWSDSEKSAIVKKGNTLIKIPANETTAYVNGTEQTLDVPAKLINKRISVPLRFISESINRTVVWDGNTSTVYIY